MSSTSFAPSFSSSPSPSPTGKDRSEASDMQKGANYFFGFLITFVILLLIFIACGVGTRRRFMRRQRAFGDMPELGWLFSMGTSTTQKEPKFHDTWLKPGEECTWPALKPISATPVWPSSTKSASAEVGRGSSQPSRRPPHPVFANSSLFSLSDLRRRVEPSRPPSPTGSVAGKASEPETPTAVCIAVLIAMPDPKPPPSTSADDEEPLREYQLGSSTLPWTGPLPSTTSATTTT